MNIVEYTRNLIECNDWQRILSGTLVALNCYSDIGTSSLERLQHLKSAPEKWFGFRKP